MSEFTNIMEENQNPPEEKSEVEEAKESGTPFEDTTTITDDLDNPVTVPGGFNIAEDSGTKVEEGIVIEDSNNNQFVWIPVGEYNVTEEIEKITEPDTQDGKLTNELTRRDWPDENVVANPILVNGDDAIAGFAASNQDEYYYGEGNENSVAKDQIDAFKTSANANKGFYIGRHEAGTEIERIEYSQLTIPLVQANIYPYVYVDRDEAKQQAEAMYSGNKYVTSELISSYAWDTALNYICQTNEKGYLLATTTDEVYGNMETNNRKKTGEYEADNYSNIHDLLGNCREWTTEYSSCTLAGQNSCILRGANYVFSGYCAASRQYESIGVRYEFDSFRIQLYINPES